MIQIILDDIPHQIVDYVLPFMIFSILFDLISALVEALLNKCIKGCTENDTLQKVHNEKKDCIFTLDFEPIGSFTSDDFEKESHPLSLMVSTI